MKFAKDLLIDEEEKTKNLQREQSPKAVIKPPLSPEERPDPSFAEKDRLFQTVKEEKSSERGYAKILGVIILVVIVVGVGVSYFSLPRVGDQIRGPKKLEAVLRDHFQVKEKREATDIEFYQCEGFYWIRVHVAKRPDIAANPIYSIGSYGVKATPNGEGWDIAAMPINSPEQDVPCK